MVSTSGRSRVAQGKIAVRAAPRPALAGPVLAPSLQTAAQRLRVVAPPPACIALRQHGASCTHGAREERGATRSPLVDRTLRPEAALSRLEAAHQPASGALDAHG